MLWERKSPLWGSSTLFSLLDCRTYSFVTFSHSRFKIILPPLMKQSAIWSSFTEALRQDYSRTLLSDPSEPETIISIYFHNYVTCTMSVGTKRLLHPEQQAALPSLLLVSSHRVLQASLPVVTINLEMKEMMAAGVHSTARSPPQTQFALSQVA